MVVFKASKSFTSRLVLLCGMWFYAISNQESIFLIGYHKGLKEFYILQEDLFYVVLRNQQFVFLSKTTNDAKMSRAITFAKFQTIYI